MFARRWPFIAPQDAQSADARAREIDEELAGHMALLREECLANGMSSEAAEAEAARRFGDVELLRRRCIAISHGGFTMWFRISIALNVFFIVILAVGAGVYLSATVRARAALDVAQADRQQALAKTEDALRRSIWKAESGQVRVEGLVARPGEFGVSLEHPVTLRELLTLAGGPAEGAKVVVLRRAGAAGGEETRTLEDLHGIPPQPADVTPGPGDVVIVR
jgi:hypothetical protein